MTSTPSFSSFPDFSIKNEAGPSKSTVSAPVPSFGSFPEIEVPKKSRRRSRSRSISEDDRRSKRRERDEERSKGNRTERVDHDRERDRERSDRHKSDRRDEEGDERRKRDKDKDRKRDRGRSRDRDRERHRHRDRSRDREKDRYRDKSAERKYKEDKRRKERNQALQLIRGDEIESLERNKKKEEKWIKNEEGQPWYESMGEVKVAEVDMSQSTTFFPDIIGDRDAIRYGSTSSSTMPRYHREGKNRILGLNAGLRIIYSRDRTQKGVEIAPMGKPYVPRYNSRQTESAASQHLRRILLVPSETSSFFDPFASYVDFEIQPVRRDENDLPAYRDISKPQAEEDDFEHESIQNAIGSYTTLEEEVRKKTIETEEYLRSNPNDIDKWIEYSQLHLRLSPDRLTYNDNISSSDQSKSKTKSEAEITLSILSKALDASINNFNSVQLHLAYLKAAEHFWPKEKVTSRWKNVLSELSEKNKGKHDIQIEMMDLWLNYISWCEGQGFSKSGDQNGVDEVIEVYEECIGNLKNSSTYGDIQAREENLVYLFLRACLFIKEAGYAERAISAFQALMEITFFKPDQLRAAANTSFETILDEFEQFWDTEAPRLGEAGSEGWRNTSNTTFPTGKQFRPLQHTSDDPFERWLEAENHSEFKYSMPGRATDLDEEVEDDPYHTILFSDIRSLLFPITSPEVRLQLIYAFLTFLGLPFTPPDIPSSTPASNDPHLYWTLAHNQNKRNYFWPARPNTKKIPWQTVGGEPMDPERTRGLDSPFQSPVKCWLQDRDSMLGRKGTWFTDLDNIDISVLNVDLIRNVFSILRPLVPDPAFTLASFAFESAVSPKGAIKSAKAILASDRDNLLLWDGYARLERQRGNVGAARTVYATALQAAMSSRKENVVSEDELDLWSGWAEMELEVETDETRALEVVILAAGIGQDRIAESQQPERIPQSPSSIALLKARQFYSTLHHTFSPSLLLLKSLFVYLADGIESVRSFLLNRLTAIQPSSEESEQTLQLLTKILHFHSTRHASPAGLSRDTLELALSSFPNNTSFLSLYLYGELGGRVYGRIQRLITELTSHKNGSGGLIIHLWSIWAEAVSSHRTFWDDGGNGAERVRLALDKGINSPTGKHCAALWMLYIEFECLMGKYQSAKQLCYRAVTSLGGCKQLYLLPFTKSLRPHYTNRELKHWAELMIERGIRLRIPFENYFDTQQDEEEGLLRLPEDEDLKEDELGFLTEREVAKPY
ncbi:uncharacterized protein L201_001348 [Kwoniella dendrophila CBS 6074]|uniref:NRDE-2, necessary for RNA interference-domain-containing protein n=1 Tax=Kwoniella dendrophila CBS 6074 TaxID=1295534 RepID=A0AAX4JM24_9TREE